MSQVIAAAASAKCWTAIWLEGHCGAGGVSNVVILEGWSLEGAGGVSFSLQAATNDSALAQTTSVGPGKDARLFPPQGLK